MKQDKVYYVDILDIRDTYKFSGSIQPEQTKKVQMLIMKY